MSEKLTAIKNRNGDIGIYTFWCPSCKCNHPFDMSRWTFNGDMEKPTFSPSLRVFDRVDGKLVTVCHLFLRDGVIEYCSDCPHEYAGRKVPPLVDIELKVHDGKIQCRLPSGEWSNPIEDPAACDYAAMSYDKLMHVKKPKNSQTQEIKRLRKAWRDFCDAAGYPKDRPRFCHWVLNYLHRLKT